MIIFPTSLLKYVNISELLLVPRQVHVLILKNMRYIIVNIVIPRPVETGHWRSLGYPTGSSMMPKVQAPGMAKEKWTLSSGQTSIIPKPELRGFWEDSLAKPPFKVTSAEVVIICPAKLAKVYHLSLSDAWSLHIPSQLSWTQDFRDEMKIKYQGGFTLLVSTRMTIFLISLGWGGLGGGLFSASPSTKQGGKNSQVDQCGCLSIEHILPLCLVFVNAFSYQQLQLRNYSLNITVHVSCCCIIPRDT